MLGPLSYCGYNLVVVVDSESDFNKLWLNCYIDSLVKERIPIVFKFLTLFILPKFHKFIKYVISLTCILEKWNTIDKFQNIKEFMLIY